MLLRVLDAFGGRRLPLSGLGASRSVHGREATAARCGCRPPTADCARALVGGSSVWRGIRAAEPGANVRHGLVAAPLAPRSSRRHAAGRHGGGRRALRDLGLAPHSARLPRAASYPNVGLVVSGEPRELAAGVGLSVFRIAQEALTITLKRASAKRATVAIAYARDGSRSKRSTTVKVPRRRSMAAGTVSRDCARGRRLERRHGARRADHGQRVRGQRGHPDE